MCLNHASFFLKKKNNNFTWWPIQRKLKRIVFNGNSELCFCLFAGSDACIGKAIYLLISPNRAKVGPIVGGVVVVCFWYLVFGSLHEMHWFHVFRSCLGDPQAGFCGRFEFYFTIQSGFERGWSLHLWWMYVCNFTLKKLVLYVRIY